MRLYLGLPWGNSCIDVENLSVVCLFFLKETVSSLLKTGIKASYIQIKEVSRFQILNERNKKPEQTEQTK